MEKGSFVARPSDQASSLRAMGALQGSAIPLRRSTWSGTRSIAVTSGKGGVGKSQIAASLAVLFGRMGARVLCIDADLGLASLDLMLGLAPTADLRDVLSGAHKVEDVLLQGPAGVSLLPACPGGYEIANLSDVERVALRRALAPIAGRFDVVVVDTGAGIGSNAVSFAASGEEVILVITPDPTSMRDAYAMAKSLWRRHGVRRVEVVMNQVASEDEGRRLWATFDELCGRFLDIEVGLLGSIPRDPQVPMAVARGVPVPIAQPGSPAALAISGIVRRLVARGDAERPARDGFWADLLSNPATESP